MSLAQLTSDLTGEGWTQQEINDLVSLIVEAVALRQVLSLARNDLSACLSRWNGGVSAKVASLPALFALSNPTNLAGTGPITKENLTNNLMAYVTTIQAMSSQAHLDNVLPLIGTVNAP